MTAPRAVGGVDDDDESKRIPPPFKASPIQYPTSSTSSLRSRVRHRKEATEGVAGECGAEASVVGAKRGLKERLDWGVSMRVA